MTDSSAVKKTPAGFTLVELLVVMVLLALSVSIWYGVNFRQRDSFRLRTAARSLHAFFLASRSYALLADQDNECQYLPAARVVEESLRHRRQELPPGIDVCLSVDGEPLVGEEPEVLLTFYADGSAAGGPLFLRSGSRQLLLEVDPVLGEVKISVPGDEME